MNESGAEHAFSRADFRAIGNAVLAMSGRNRTVFRGLDTQASGVLPIDKRYGLAFESVELGAKIKYSGFNA